MKFSLTAVTTAVALATSSLVSGQEVISLNGSGTTNPSKCYWQIMDMFETQTKLPTKLTYRAVGSSTGQAEFIGSIGSPDNDFGSGDIPIPNEEYTQLNDSTTGVYHFPILLGAISFFHSVPQGASEKLNLTPCLLARIFKREITSWSDPAIVDLNPGLATSGAIRVARRVKGSSSTASITQYLNTACPAEWPADLVGKTIDWPADTVGCEGSGGMTDCINNVPGTIGYIDAGHGQSEGLPEIELQNADGNYLSSAEAASRGGIMAAAANAGIPAELTGDFSNVQLLNQPGPNTWPIVALSYVYVRQDLTFMSNPASQTLLQAFLRALYDDEFIPICEEEFGFFRVEGELREKALAAIDGLTITPGAPQWSFEVNTEKRTGQGDYVISQKRKSWSEIEQEDAVETIEVLQSELKQLQAEYAILATTLAELTAAGGNSQQLEESVTSDSDQDESFIQMLEDDEDNQVRAALILASISFVLWMLAIIVIIARYALGV